MDRFGVKNFVFSSSATVYGEPDTVPVNESARLGPVTNPYGRTKLFVEEMLRDLCASDPEWNVCLLRYSSKELHVTHSTLFQLALTHTHYHLYYDHLYPGTSTPSALTRPVSLESTRTVFPTTSSPT